MRVAAMVFSYFMVPVSDLGTKTQNHDWHQTDMATGLYLYLPVSEDGM